ncbi:hypothetical protein [Pseudonocardia xinjiangensis]|uniref:Uncharacterized protein n=1 Tax=Pseudonocardia xinjiangensis TaxID=75289 RepID=A0ABX1RRB2_9PSEU|nr:hypothetical protein [Pseudonocardia xinjiangensis]NMH81635.1 hypothetical protein [Pseudonocardia xinjiangensis]
MEDVNLIRNGWPSEPLCQNSGDAGNSPAIADTFALGIDGNVTLIFSAQRYRM